MQVQLIVTNKSNHGQVIPVNVPAFRIGQAEDCHLRSQSSQISQQHCVIYIHEGTVTIQDLGGKTGTIVNDKRITSTVTLKDGDQLAVGRHSFTLSIKSETAPLATSQSEVFDLAHSPKPEPEPEAEIMFEVRHKGQNVSVTQARLFEMARKGMVLPDDIIIIAGTKVFADSVRGIVFGKESSEATPLPHPGSAADSAAHAPAQPSGMAKNAPAPPVFHGSAGPPIVEESPFDIAKEPIVQIDRVHGAKKDVTFTDLGKSLEKPLSQASTWMGSNVAKHHIVIVGSVLVALCLLGCLVYSLIPLDWKLGKSLCGAVYIAGTLTLNGEPVEDASVVLHARAGEDFTAYGRTDKRGRFTVTTGADPVGRGAVPGEYDVTFRKKGEIPSEYENPQTLINLGLAPIRVEASENKPFVFELTSGTTSPRPPAAPEAGFVSPPPTTGARPGAEPAPLSPPPSPVPLNVPSYQEPAPSNAATGQEKQVMPVTETEGVTQPTRPTVPSPPPSPQRTFENIFDAMAMGTASDVQPFLARGIDIEQTNDLGRTLLHQAARFNSDAGVVRLLLARRAIIDARNKSGWSPLHEAANENSNVAVLRALVEQGRANVNAIIPDSERTPLHCAALNNRNVDVLRFLLSCPGASINLRDSNNDTPLHLAARFNSEEVLQFLASQRGIEINARNKSGETAWDSANTEEKKSILREAGGRSGKE